MRLIDADALMRELEIFRDNDPYKKLRNPAERIMRRERINMIMRCIMKMPTIEVAEQEVEQ